MSELKRTATVTGAAIVLFALALVTAPRRAAPDAFFDVGQPFFPEFTDPQQAATLEVVEFDAETAAAIPFEVRNRNGLWTIPSHHGYPADGAERLAKTAAGIIELQKADFRSDNVSDHETLGVIDPLDDSVAALQGRGKRVTVKDATELVLADLIIGSEVQGSPGFRFVRVPGQSRVYAANLGFEISTKFEDWIDRDLLQVERDDMTRIIRNDYQIVEEPGGFAEMPGASIGLEKRGEDEWEIMPRPPANRELDMVRMNLLIGVLDQLVLQGVRPKPPGIAQNLRTALEQGTMTRDDYLSLQGHGFFVNQDGELYSTQGELVVWSRDGVRYILRFGQVVYGAGEAVTIGATPNEQEKAGPADNRYMMISAEFDPTTMPEPRRPANRDFENTPETQWTETDRQNQKLADAYASWERRVAEGRQRAASLGARFARWYYVISNDSFDRLRINRDNMLKARESQG